MYSLHLRDKSQYLETRPKLSSTKFPRPKISALDVSQQPQMISAANISRDVRDKCQESRIQSRRARKSKVRNLDIP